MISFTQKYFFLYLLRARNRQKLLIFSLMALSLSSLALLVIQSTMGGMQSQVINRSKKIEGSYEIKILNKNKNLILKLEKYLTNNKILFLKELKKELLLKQGNLIKPVIVHGVDKRPFFIKSNLKKFELFIPFSLSYSLNITKGKYVSLFSPFELDSFISEIPNKITLITTEVFDSNLPEIDTWHIWVKLSKVQNLIRAKNISSFVIYQNLTQRQRVQLQNIFKNKIVISAWESTHQALSFALKLENIIMIFLFASMSLLVTLSIISGFLLFWEKIKYDLSYFWVVGVSKDQAYKTVFSFIINLNIFSIVLGLIFGTFFLYLFKVLAPNLMPDVFVDRSIPVLYKSSFYLIAFMVPFIISFIFSVSLAEYFKRETDFFTSLKKNK